MAAVPRKKGLGPKPKMTPAWEKELLRVIDDDPREYGVNSANWTTQLLADYLAANGWSAGMDDILLERPRWLDFVRSKASLDKGPYRCIMFIALVDRDASLAPASGPALCAVSPVSRALGNRSRGARQ